MPENMEEKLVMLLVGVMLAMFIFGRDVMMLLGVTTGWMEGAGTARTLLLPDFSVKEALIGVGRKGSLVVLLPKAANSRAKVLASARE